MLLVWWRPLAALVASLLIMSCGGDSFDASQAAGGASGAGAGGAAGSAGGGAPDAGPESGAGGKHDGGEDAAQEGTPTCGAGSEDCDGDPSNGCETNVLTTPTACGACGHDCLGGGCSGGKCEPVQIWVPDAHGAAGTSLSVTDAGVFFTLGKGAPTGAVGRVPHAGGEPAKWFAEQQNSPMSVTSVAGMAYWVDTGFHQINKSDGTTVSLITTVGAGSRPFAVGGGFIYYADASVSQVFKIKADGSGKTMVASAAVTSLALSPGGALFYTTKTSVVMSDTMGAKTIDGTYTDVQDVRASTDWVCWSDFGAAQIFAMTMVAKKPAAVGPAKTQEIALDATHVYFAVQDPPEIRRQPLKGGAVEHVAASAGVPADVEVDAVAVYWISGLDGSVYRVAK